MGYKIIVFLSPGCQFNEKKFTSLRKFEENNSVSISKLENLGSIDISLLLKAIYEGFDGIFLIIRNKSSLDKFSSEYNSFHKSKEEVNRILKRRGLGDKRVKFFKFNGTNQKELYEAFNDFLRKLIHYGPNPINSGIRKMSIKDNYHYNFVNTSIKKLLYATFKASYNFQYRSLFRAKEKILELGRYNENELNSLLDSIFEAETAKKYILEELKRYKSLTLEEIIDFFDSSEKYIIRDLFILKSQGFIEEIVEKDENKLMYKYKIKDIKHSFKENYFKSISIVHENKLCCRCGLCSSICPVNCINLIDNNLFIDEVNCITCGLCFSVCPKSFSLENIKKYINKSVTSLKYSEGLGYYKNIYSARTLKYTIKKVGQDGGIVTSLLYYLLSKKLVDAVITIKHSETYWKPNVSLVEKLGDLYKTAGSTYVHASILSILDQAKKYNKIAIVALPCKINALSKGKLFPVKLPLLNNIKYKIGLFCKESFSYEKLINLFNKKFSVSIDEIVKMDINQGKFVLTIGSGEIFSIPLKECDSYCSDFCDYCNDFTAELADISIGSIGSELGWSSIITRTKKGEEVFNGAINSGLIEVKNIIDKKPLQLKIIKQAEIKRDSSRPIEFNIAY